MKNNRIFAAAFALVLALAAEIALVVAGAALLVLGVWRERRARRA